jgi:glycerate kinase
VLETTGFAQLVSTANWVLTGEGATDGQTANGKAPVGVAMVAQKFGVPTICLSGGLGEGCDAVLTKGISGLMSIVSQPMTLEDCMLNAAELVERASLRLCNLIHTGIEIGKMVNGKK